MSENEDYPFIKNRYFSGGGAFMSVCESKKESSNKTPIVLLAYNRPEILEKTLESIAACNNSEKYSLYVFIDAPNIYRDDDVCKHGRILELLAKFENKFAYFSIKKAIHHKGLASSVISSVNEIIKLTEKVIVIEDDHVISYDCLDFLEDALAYYESDSKVWSVTAYSPPLKILDGYEKSVFYTYRGCSWVWGTWKDRWEKVDWEVSDYDNFIKDPDIRKRFCRGGYDLPIMLRQQMEGIVDSWAVRWCYAQSKLGMWTVHPVNNRVYLTDFASGTHVHKKISQKVLLENYPKYKFEENIDSNVIEEYKERFGGSLENIEANFFDINNAGRFESMFNVMHLWKEINENGHSIAEYFESRKYLRIGIYGMGKIGRQIERELLNSKIKVEFFIDRNPELCDGSCCYKIEDIWPVVDCIVISVTTGINEISKMIKNSYSGDIKSIIDVLRDR